MTASFLNTGLKEALIKNLISIFTAFPTIEQVSLYGSRAKGTYRHGSDVDLAFFGSISQQEMIKVDLLIDDLLTPYSYDLTVVEEVNSQALIEHINRVGIVIYKK